MKKFLKRLSLLFVLGLPFFFFLYGSLLKHIYLLLYVETASSPGICKAFLLER